MELVFKNLIENFRYVDLLGLLLVGDIGHNNTQLLYYHLFEFSQLLIKNNISEGKSVKKYRKLKFSILYRIRTNNGCANQLHNPHTLYTFFDGIRHIFVDCMLADDDQNNF